MKKFKILLALLAIMPVSLLAQLKMDASGRTILGTNKTYSNGISFYDNGGTSPFRIFRNSDNNVYFTRGTTSRQGFKMNSAGKISIGADAAGAVNEWGLLNITTDQSVTCMEVHMKYNFDLGAGVVLYPYRANTRALVLNLDGNRNFQLYGDGRVEAKQYITLSDISLKKDVENIQNPLSKVLKMRGITYNSSTDEVTDIILPEELENENLRSGVITENNIEPIPADLKRQLMNEKKRKHMGLIAQEVEEVVPEVVRTTPEGLKSVAYSELVGLLIEAIKEQQIQIEEQQNQIDDLKFFINTISENFRQDMAIENYSSSLEMVVYPSVPNPFRDETTITFTLFETVKNANLYIYDMNGKQIKNIPVNSRGNSSVNINGSELEAGMYIYTLIADGKEIGTHRMILTK